MFVPICIRKVWKDRLQTGNGNCNQGISISVSYISMVCEFFPPQQSPITFIIGEKRKAWKKETASIKRGSGDCNIKKLESV